MKDKIVDFMLNYGISGLIILTNIAAAVYTRDTQVTVMAVMITAILVSDKIKERRSENQDKRET